MRETGCLKEFHGESSFNVINYLLICRLCKESFLIFNLPKNPDSLRLLFLNTFITPERISWLSFITERTSRLQIPEITSRVHTATQPSSSGLRLLTDWQLLPPQSLCSRATSAGKTVATPPGPAPLAPLVASSIFRWKLLGSIKMLLCSHCWQTLLNALIWKDRSWQRELTWANCRRCIKIGSSTQSVILLSVYLLRRNL